MKDILIRDGNENDLPSVLKLIQELAIYEKSSAEAILTIQELVEDFTQKKAFNFVVAEFNNEIIGMALYFFKYSTWKGRTIYIDDIIVTENYRRLGIGKLMFDRIITKAKIASVQKIEWMVLKWNEPAISFYNKYKANFNDEWLLCTLAYSTYSK